MRIRSKIATSSMLPTSDWLALAGSLLLAHTSACAGPCTQLEVWSSRGQRIGEPVQLDDRRFVVLGEYAQLAVFELKTGRRLGVLALDGDPEGATITRLDREAVSTLYETMGGWIWAKVHVGGKAPAVLHRRFFPRCR